MKTLTIVLGLLLLNLSVVGCAADARHSDSFSNSNDSSYGGAAIGVTGDTGGPSFTNIDNGSGF